MIWKNCWLKLNLDLNQCLRFYKNYNAEVPKQGGYRSLVRQQKQTNCLWTFLKARASFNFQFGAKTFFHFWCFLALKLNPLNAEKESKEYIEIFRLDVLKMCGKPVEFMLVTFCDISNHPLSQYYIGNISQLVLLLLQEN